MKTSEALSVYTALSVISNSGRQVPTKFAYASVINRKKLGAIAEAFAEARKPLVEKYALKDEAGNPVEKDGALQFVNEPMQKSFTDEVTMLTEVENAVTLHKVAVADFPSPIEEKFMEWLMPMALEPAEDKR